MPKTRSLKSKSEPETFSLPKSYWALAFLISLAISLASLLTACEPIADTGDDSDARLQAEGLTAKQLVNEDVLALQNQVDFADSSRPYPAFSKYYVAAFGGFTADDTLHYLNTRIHHYISEYDYRHGEVLRNVPDATFARGNDDDNDPTPPANTIVGASNIGTSLWITQILSGKAMTVLIDETVIPVRDSRVGIMEIGPGYNYRSRLPDGTSGSPPVEVRQATLIHEARHSDCTGGFPASTLEILRRSPPQDKLFENYLPKACGHLHVKCPYWHPLHGAAACDDLPWGAYSIENLYENAALNAALDAGDYLKANALRAAAYDSLSRLLYIVTPSDFNHTPDARRIWNGEFGLPDMSSTGVVNE